MVQPGGLLNEVDAVNWDAAQVLEGEVAVEFVRWLVVWGMVALWDSPVPALD